jgi:hypothetical protein
MLNQFVAVARGALGRLSPYIFCFAALSAFPLAALGAADSLALADSSEAPRFGLGVSLTPYIFPDNDSFPVQPAGNLAWQIPVQFGRFFRVEAEIQYAQSNDSLQVLLDNTLQTRNYRQTAFGRVGMGVYFTPELDVATRLVIGARSGVAAASVTWESFIVGQSMTEPFRYNESIGSFWFGGVVGFEYSLGARVAVGADARLTRYETGATSSTSPLPANYPARFPFGRSSAALVTGAAAHLRVFF